MPVDKFGRMSDAKTKDTGVSLTYINNNYIRSDGTTPVSGSINMDGNTLYNVSDPVNPQDVATKEYTDNKRKHITSHYVGSLRKKYFQFPFGGIGREPSINTPMFPSGYGYPGFVIPHSGRIIKVKMITSINEITLENFLIYKDRVDLDYTKDGFFSFTNYNKDGYFDYIGTIRCREAYKLYFKKPDSDEKKFFGYDFCFDDDLPIDRPKVKEGDIINIKTMIDLEFPRFEDINFDVLWDLDKQPEVGNFPVFENKYLVTILIELDPL